jgi:hypothetical protein
MAQRRDQIARGGLSWTDRRWGQTTGVLLGYGYQPWRALVWLVGVFAVSVTLAVVLGAHGALVKAANPNAASPPAGSPTTTTTATALAEPCPLIDTVGRGLDLGTPFLPRAATGCKTTTGATGAALTINTWWLQLFAWAFAALFVAGFTGIVRKT